MAIRILVGALVHHRGQMVVREGVGAKTLGGATRTWSDIERTYDYWGERLRARGALFRNLDAASAEEGV